MDEPAAAAAAACLTKTRRPAAGGLLLGVLWISVGTGFLGDKVLEARLHCATRRYIGREEGMIKFKDAEKKDLLVINVTEEGSSEDLARWRSLIHCGGT
ncbi:hypothetical protein E2C01_095055 [Portunus trituberculatus]|uniref:Uncharacterized protein n=1 Tax=Portunus trituberculatus TaxID=210409 RepID=A0A5B7K3B3_PORTR|nr:hypothetical protein [Portunus trituberculatus]